MARRMASRTNSARRRSFAGATCSRSRAHRSSSSMRICFIWKTIYSPGCSATPRMRVKSCASERVPASRKTPDRPSRCAARSKRLELVLRNLVAKDALGRPERPGRAGEIAFGRRKGVLDHPTFELLYGLRERELALDGDVRRKAKRLGQVAFFDDAALAGHHGSLDRILELTYVAGPIVLTENVECTAGDPLCLATMFARVLLEKVFDQGGHVRAALAQRRHRDL